MFEYHGWATIYTDKIDKNGDTDEDTQAELIAELKAVLNEKAPYAIVSEKNVIWTLELAGCNNHRNSWIIEVFQWLAEHGRHSYGLLYIRDDEDFKRGHDYSNVFRVWRLKMGQLDELADPFLSPCIPTVEPPYED